MQEDSRQQLRITMMEAICHSRVGNRRATLSNWFGLAWIAVLLAGCGGSSPPPAVDIGSVLDSQWKARYAKETPGGLTAMLITPNGEYFASTVAGTTPATHFRAASTTKTFTAAAIMLLDQRGQLKIDDVLTAAMPGGSGKPYLPATAGFAIPYKGQITIRQLLQHRAGVFDVANTDIPANAPAPYAGKRYVVWKMEQDGDHSFSPDEMIGVVASNQLAESAPGTRFVYCDTGYSVLAKIIEQVSGKSFAQFIQDEFLVPNGLANTTFPNLGTTQGLPSPYIDGYLLLSGMQSNTTLQNVSSGTGDGNVVTTTANLAQWFRRLLRGEAGVSSSQLARMRECIPTGSTFVISYGLGLECYPTAFGQGHNGGNPGYLTVARHDVDANVTVVLFSTFADYDHADATVEWLYDTVAKMRAAAGY
jgi:D-alanyl-D-alanine carboxypeptidase